MPGIKLIGVLLVAICCGGICFEARRRDAERLARVDGFLRLLAFIRSEIDCFLTPQSRIFSKCDVRMLYDCGRQGGEPPRDFSGLLSSVRGGLDPRVREQLMLFSSSLGKSFREEQLRSCDGCIEALRKLHEELEAELPRKRRASLSLGICAAAAAAVILF